MDKLITKKALEEIIAKSIKDYHVFAPVSQDGIKLFGHLSGIEQINWYDCNCFRSPKELFFPMTQAIFTFRRTKKRVQIDTNGNGNHDKKRIIFGLRPCDARALKIIDNVFAWDYEDNLYLSLRENSLIITISCLEPDPYCFCSAMNSSPFDEAGSDILLTKLDNDLFHVRIITKKGESFSENLKGAFRDADTGHEKQIENLKKSVLKRMPKPFPLNELKAWLDNNFEHPVWEKISQGCIGCGTCAYLCPTCHCFDLVDEAAGYAGKRLRNWDSCAFEHFTRMAAHQPRSYQWQRFRQRVMHKFKYFPDRFSKVACVGCGRCRALCPAGKDIFHIIEILKKEMELAPKNSEHK